MTGMQLSTSAVIYLSFIAAHLAVRLWPTRKRKRPAEDAKAFLFEALNAGVIATFYVLLPFLALFTSLLSRFDYSAPAAFHWLSIPVFADSIWTFWLVHSGVSAMINRKERHPRSQPSKFASLWIWTVGQSLCIPNVLGGVGSLAAFGLLCFARIFRQDRVEAPVFANEFTPVRVPAYME